MKLKNLKKLKNYKHYEKLVNKSKGTGPMPQLRWVSNLLTELNIEHRYHDWSETKWRPNGLRYHTSGGSREYTGGRLWISDINMDICSTDTYYSWNTWSYVRDILNYINEKINLK
tara:strand:+ start:175 stop:519 length:345 start_codon:yes stop_codon:yes gene_type:complete